jgi:hypothetical protein
MNERAFIAMSQANVHSNRAAENKFTRPSDVSSSSRSHASLSIVVSMDQKEDCGQVRRPKHDVVEGDVFVVRSDGYNGKATSDQRQPAECSIGFNFGDRLLSLSVVDWACDQPYSEPFLLAYADCDGGRKILLVRVSVRHIKITESICFR